jgi:hypothetical protein
MKFDDLIMWGLIICFPTLSFQLMGKNIFNVLGGLNEK